MRMNRPRFAELSNMLAGMYAATELQQWDALWSHPRSAQFVRNCYAEGLNHNHIATGLRTFFRGRENNASTQKGGN